MFNARHFLLLFIILSTSAIAQDVTVTLTTKFQGTAVSLDSIFVENILNGTRVMMTDLPAAITTYEINLSKGKIIYGIKELHGSGFGFFLYSNTPGRLMFYARFPALAQINLRLYDLTGQLVFKKSLNCPSGTSLISFRPGYIPTGILSVEGSGYKQGFKVTGCKDESIGVSIADEPTLSSDFSGKTFFKEPTDSDDFIFTPGDSVRFSVYHHDIYPGSVLCQPQQDDSIVLDVSRPCPGFPVISDYDGNRYTTVQIGTHCWMRENMNTTHYADGIAMIDGTGVGNIGVDCTIKYWFNYEDHPENNVLYGRLYTWSAVMNGNDGTSIARYCCQFPVCYRDHIPPYTGMFS